VTLQQKYKIQKRVKEYKRKLKKAGKKLGPNGGEWKSKKEAAIPNDWPFKAQMLSEIERQKQMEKDAQEKNKQARKVLAEKKKRDAAAGIVSKPEESVLPKGMGAPIPPTAAESNAILLDAATKRHWREVKQAVEEADVVLEVLDARDPLGSRCLELESWAHGKLREKAAKSGAGAEAAPKPIILVLNKVDLVPVSVTQAWLDFFAKHDALFPVVAFHTHRGLDSSEHKGTVVSPKEVCAGAETLLQLIHTLHADAQQQQQGDVPATLKVACIGFGNVGKSSVLNTLARTHLAGVGPIAGYTKSLARFRLSKGVYMVDTPAVPTKDEAPGPHIELPLSHNRIKQDVEQFLRHFDLENVMQVLQLPASAIESIDAFLGALARRVRMMKGAELNLVLAARTLLKDWNSGKIPYFTAPPDMDEEDDEEKEEEETPEPSALQQFFVASNRRVLLSLKAGTCTPAVKPCPPESAFLVVEGSLFEEVPDEDDEEGEDGEEEEEDEEMEDGDEDMEDDEEEEEEEEEETPPPQKKGGKAKQQQQPQQKQQTKKQQPAAPAAAPVSRKRGAAQREEEEEAPAPPAKKKQAVAPAAAGKANGNKPASKPVAAPAPVAAAPKSPAAGKKAAAAPAPAAAAKPAPKQAAAAAAAAAPASKKKKAGK